MSILQDASRLDTIQFTCTLPFWSCGGYGSHQYSHISLSPWKCNSQTQAGRNLYPDKLQRRSLGQVTKRQDNKKMQLRICQGRSQLHHCHRLPGMYFIAASILTAAHKRHKFPSKEVTEGRKNSQKLLSSWKVVLQSGVARRFLHPIWVCSQKISSKIWQESYPLIFLKKWLKW